MMSRQFTEKTLVLATHNQGKVKEIGRLLQHYVPHFVTAADCDLSEPEETGSTFSENAILKARQAATKSGFVSLADDSGLSVSALGGAPGIYSARWAGAEKNFQKAMQDIHEKIGDDPDRTATFICTLALAWPDGHVEIATGQCEGTIIWPPRGINGFGYDPFFVPQGHHRTFTEMGTEQKQEFSHRAKAFSSLIKQCFQ